MASLVIDPIPDRLLERLRAAAASHHRSPAEEARELLERFLPGPTEMAAARLEQIRAFHRSLEGRISPLTDEILAEARGERRS